MTERYGVSHSIIGESRQVQEVRATIEKFAARPTPVIIYGETGTGKELFACILEREELR